MTAGGLEAKYAKPWEPLFSRGLVQQAFQLWKQDPGGGAAPDMPADITTYEWARHAYFLRNRDGSYVFPRSCWLSELGLPTPHPYSYIDEDASIQYALATKKTFLSGRVDEAYLRYMNDPLGGGALQFCRTTKEQFVDSMQREIYADLQNGESYAPSVSI
ncbi:MAG: hypothetical protein EPN79_16060 [Burkholderiaceae bacterium]|nr:MAG: hypothetical protein EPN79_16060 [Burkholderiaceae bacterium]